MDGTSISGVQPVDELKDRGGHTLVIRLPNKPNETKDSSAKPLKSEGRMRVIWTWCPACYVRQVVEVLNEGKFRCTVCKHTWRR
jgi:hypothetical protein